jgi:hypothetical protein
MGGDKAPLHAVSLGAGPFPKHFGEGRHPTVLALVADPVQDDEGHGGGHRDERRGGHDEEEDADEGGTAQRVGHHRCWRRRR